MHLLLQPISSARQTAVHRFLKKVKYLKLLAPLTLVVNYSYVVPLSLFFNHSIIPTFYQKKMKKKASQNRRVSRRQRKLNNKLIAHQAVEVNGADKSVEGTSNSEDDEYAGMEFRFQHQSRICHS
jgi:hypothetical protein